MIWSRRKETAQVCPVVIWDGDSGRLWAQANNTELTEAKHWFWQERQQPLPNDLQHTNMQTIASLLPCGTVRWYRLMLPPATGEEMDEMLAWEMAELIGEETEGKWVFQILPHESLSRSALLETVVAVLPREIEEQIKTVLPQGVSEWRLVPEESAIGAALPTPEAQVLRSHSDQVTVLRYRHRCPVEVIPISNENEITNSGLAGVPWYVVADEDDQCRYWQKRLQAQSWPLLAHAEYLRANGEWCEQYPQIVLGASQAALGALCWKQKVGKPHTLFISPRLRRVGHWGAMGIGGLGICSMLLGGYTYHTSQTSFEKVASIYTEHSSGQRALEELSAAEEILAKRQQQRNIWSKNLLIIADSRPQGVYLTEIREEDHRIVLEGICLQQEPLQSWKEYLQLRLQRRATVKYTHAKQQNKREFQMVLHENEEN